MDTKPQSGSFLVFLSVFWLILILLVGIGSSIYVGNVINAKQRQTLLERAKTASFAIDIEDVNALSGTIEDIGNFHYERIKETLMHIHTANSDTRFAYLMEKRGDTLLFMADSEDPTSKDYSPPGDVYYEAKKDELAQFGLGKPYSIGPTSDRWGTWFTAYVPLALSADSDKIIQLGMDVSAKEWQSQIWFARGMIGFATLLLSIGVIIMLVYSRKNASLLAWLGRTHEELKQSRDYLSEAERLAKLGRFTLNVVTGTMTWNNELYNMFDVPSDEKTTLDTVREHVIASDREKFSKAIHDALHSTDDTFTLSFRIKSRSHAEKHIYGICSVTRSPRGEAMRVVGALQDITDRPRGVHY